MGKGELLASEDDVLLRPGMHFVAMGAGELVGFDFLVGPELFFHHLAGNR